MSSSERPEILTRITEEAVPKLIEISQSWSSLDECLVVPPRNIHGQSLLRDNVQVQHDLSLLGTCRDHNKLMSLDLRSAKSNLSRRETPVHKMLSPISILPNELLIHIFEICNKSLANHPDVLLAITHTCSRWRYLAINYSLLWADINVLWRRRRVETWIARACSLPLKVNVGYPGETHKKSSLARLKKAIPRIKDRIASLILSRSEPSMSSPYGMEIYYALLDTLRFHEFPALRSLRLEFYADDMNSVPHFSLDSSLPFCFPSLQSLFLERVRVFGLTAPAFSNLKSLRVSEIKCTLKGWKRVFQALVHLEDLELIAVDWQDKIGLDGVSKSFADGWPPLSQLRSLALHDIKYRLYDLIALVPMPGLKRLTMSTSSNPFSSSIRTMILQLPHLEVLSVSDENRHDPDFISSVLSSPYLRAHLQELSLYKCDLPMDDFASFLGHRAGSMDFDGSGTKVFRRLELSHCPQDRIQWLQQHVEEVVTHIVTDEPYVNMRQAHHYDENPDV